MGKAIAITLNGPTVTTPLPTQQSYVAEDALITFSMSPTAAITGNTIALTFRDRANGTVLFVKPGTIVSAPTGVFTVPLAAADTDPGASPTPGIGIGLYDVSVDRTDAGNATCWATAPWQVLPR